MLSLSEKFSAVLESSDEDWYLGRKDERSEETQQMGQDLGLDYLTSLRLGLPIC